jgi:hypothetical protein
MTQLAQQVGIAVLFGVCLFIAIMIIGTLIIEGRELRETAESPTER